MSSLIVNLESSLTEFSPLSHFLLILHTFTLETPNFFAISTSLNEPSLKYTA
ncbi:hypothetical protein BBU118A_L41 (plasmid) [Borreliella burgdorferi 118a]|uniref:Uncharacterized protein n=1 Tax=Borreliella burgdorferi 118a TaxID=476210 RepID=A0A7U3YAM3_BORBG|nr:hypothetical protein BBU118A_L41 [Borreliella burgdorferi 118a]